MLDGDAPVDFFERFATISQAGLGHADLVFVHHGNGRIHAVPKAHPVDPLTVPFLSRG